MKLQQFSRPEKPGQRAGYKIELTYEGEKYESEWFDSEENLNKRIKKSPGVAMCLKENPDELKGHLCRTMQGEYIFRKWRRPKPTINYGGEKLTFHESVEDCDTAQSILDGFRESGTPAACLHNYGLHQIYIKK